MSEAKRTFRVVFELTASEKDLRHFAKYDIPSEAWIERMVAQPNSSIFRMTRCQVEEVTQ